ncbi:Uncharacterised protein [Salmonella enterica]|nr:Uncharacterised protein [Salmonella enterica]
MAIFILIIVDVIYSILKEYNELWYILWTVIINMSIIMKLLNTYEDKDEAEDALTKISGEKRLASERDSMETIYNLFGQATWSNFYKLEMFSLPELQKLLELRKAGQPIDQSRHAEIMNTLNHVSRAFDLEVPAHWL